MFLGHRNNDPVITIRQDNNKHACQITHVNPAALELLGYSSQEIETKSLADFLPLRIQALLKEYVEYEDNGNDVGSVLGKVQSFCILDKSGQEVALRLKVLRSESLDGDDYFKLILQSGHNGRRTEAFRSVLRENFKGHEVLDTITGLPDRYSLAKDIELVLFFVHKQEITASFAMIELDKHTHYTEQYGNAAVIQMLQHIAQLAKQNLRTDDTIGYLPPGRIGLIMLDTNLESSRMVLNRLRWLIAANPFILPDKTSVPLTASIAFATLGTRADDKAIIEDAEIFLERIQPLLGNTLQELPEITPRQEGNDRRMMKLPVSMERRREDRRRKKNES